MVNANTCYGASAHDYLMQAQDYLNNKYNYHEAITCFLNADDLLKSSSTSLTNKEEQALIWIGLAMSYHNIGKAALSSQYLQKAKDLLELPDRADELTNTVLFTPAAAAYLMVKGYHFYIQFEQSQRKGEDITHQEAYLHQAKNAFLKSLEISRVIGNNNGDDSHAHHALGTMFEFLGKCAQARQDWQQATQYAHQSISAFETALHVRLQWLGSHHLHVARSHHKLARNYAVLADLLTQQHSEAEKSNELYALADMHYQQAILIFESNNIPLEQSKRKELVEEYELFKKNSSNAHR